MVTLPFFSCSEYCSAINLPTPLKTLLLNDPQSPRSELTTTIRIFFSSRTWLYQLSSSPEVCAAERFCNISFSLIAKGRICVIRSCDLRNFAAATIFMALVICCVLMTEVILFLTSFKLGIVQCADVPMIHVQMLHTWITDILINYILMLN